MKTISAKALRKLKNKRKKRGFGVVQPTAAEMDPTGGWQGKGRIDLPEKTFIEAMKWFKS